MDTLIFLGNSARVAVWIAVLYGSLTSDMTAELRQHIPMNQQALEQQVATLRGMIEGFRSHPTLEVR